jgi:hypothetical protein
METYHLYGSKTNDMQLASSHADTNDLVITLPTGADAGTEISIVANDRQPVWYSFTGTASTYKKIFPYEVGPIQIPTGATAMYLRKPIKRSPDMFLNRTTKVYGDIRDIGDDVGIRLQLGVVAKK